MKVKLYDARLSFPVLFKPEQYKGKGDPMYSGTFIIDPKKTRAVRMNDDKSETPIKLDDAILEAAKEKWGEKAAQMLPDMRTKDKVCFRKTEKKTAAGEVYDGFEGM